MWIGSCIVDVISGGLLCCRFAEIWDKDKADVLVDKVDFATVDASFVNSLGHKICELPTSSLLKIPTSEVSQSTEETSLSQSGIYLCMFHFETMLDFMYLVFTRMPGKSGGHYHYHYYCC